MSIGIVQRIRRQSKHGVQIPIIRVDASGRAIAE